MRSLPPRAPGRRAIVRAIAYLALWVVLFGTDPASLAVGAATALAAAWVSLRLLPPQGWRPRLAPLLGIALRFPQQSLAAGVNVALRALDPRLPLAPGLLLQRLRLSPGIAREIFCAITSLLPGTVPSGTDEDDALVVHCLDVREPVAEQLATEEARLARALGIEGGA